MSNTIKSTTRSTEKRPREHSKEYMSIKKDAETNWPAWKVSLYNESYANSAHAKKIVPK